MQNINEILEVIAKSNSLRQVILTLGLNPKMSYNYEKLNNIIRENNVDISHFIDFEKVDKKNDDFKVKRSIEDYLNNIFKIDSYALKKKLISANILKHQCSECKLTEWQGQSIPIDLDHIDGNPNNNNLSNLRILCPTCHSYTANYCSKNAKKFKPKTTYKCIKCEKELSCKRQSGCCGECRERKDGFVDVLPKINWGPIEDLIKLVKENNYNYTKVGKILGVSRTSVRNKIKEYEL